MLRFGRTSKSSVGERGSEPETGIFRKGVGGGGGRCDWVAEQVTSERDSGPETARDTEWEAFWRRGYCTATAQRMLAHPSMRFKGKSKKTSGGCRRSSIIGETHFQKSKKVKDMFKDKVRKLGAS